MSICNSNIDSDNYLSVTSSSDESECSFVSIPSLSDNLLNILSDVAGNFNVVHINAQSIPAHFPDMLASFDHKYLHAILVSESWLKPCLPTASYSLPGFQLIRNDRTGGGGGGVAIYLRNQLPFTIISASPQPPPDEAGEHLFIEVTLCHTKVLLGVYYSSSLRVNFFSSFEKLLEELTPVYDHTIIMGDFNTCLLKKDSRSISFESILHSCNLSILPLTATHHFPNSIPSLLDVIIVSSLNHVSKHGQYPADIFSYHDLIFLSYKIRPPKPKPQILKQRNFGGMNLDSLIADVQATDWSPVRDAECIDDKIEIFNSILLSLYDIHAPLRPVKMKHLPAPWLTDDLKSLMHAKAVAKFKYKCRPTDINKDRYKARRNHCNKVCRDAQRRHIHNSIQIGDTAKVWNFLKSLGVGKSRKDSIPKDINLDSLNKHFTSSSNVTSADKSATINFLASVPTPDLPPLVFNQFTDSDVMKSILSISSNAVGTDCVSRNMILPILDHILPIVSHLLNFSILSRQFPSLWKDALITPLPKKSNPVSFSDYRPISILPFLSKVLERLIHNQLNPFLNSHNILNPLQSGFRLGHSTTTALVKITDDIRLAMDSGQITILSLLDFSNAFNTVDLDILLALLRSHNISPAVIDWFHSYLSGRRQRIRVDESYSSWCGTSAGVPQGGVLSPLLFAIFINSISHKLTSSYHLYADDLQIYTHSSLQNVNGSIDAMNTDLGSLVEWCNSFGLKINPTKTRAIIIGSPKMIPKVDRLQLPQVIVDGLPIPYSRQVRNLGIIFDSCLSWTPQLNEVSRKVFAASGSLRRLRNFLPTATKIALAQSLLLPILDYADASYLDLTEAQFNKLERLQNFAIRFIFGLRKYDHVSEFRVKLKWLPIRLRRNTHILSLLYNILFNPSSPPYLKSRFQFLHASHTLSLRSSHKLTLLTPSHSSNFYSNSFTVEAVRLWNALPYQIQSAQTVATFKKLLKIHYLSLN